MLSDKIRLEIDSLPLIYQEEVFNFILFLKDKVNKKTDTEYLTENSKIKQTIIDGLNTPLAECSKDINW